MKTAWATWVIVPAIVCTAQAADAAAAAPECKDTPMKDQACKPGDTGNPAKDE